MVADRSVTGHPTLEASTLVRMYTDMVRARVLDERMWILNRQGHAPFVISCQGHEGVQVAMGEVLRPRLDWVAPYYRDLALTLVMGMTMKDHLLAALAKADDPNSGGRQMPSHYGCRRLNILSGGSPVATQVLHACGIALASRMRGEDAVTMVSVGEGGTSEGDFHEGLNFAAVHRLPVVCVVENNGFAISVPLAKQMGTPDVAARAAGYGIEGATVDGGDVVGCFRELHEAMARARSGGGPTLIDAKVERLTAHSSDDDDRLYRTTEDIATMKTHDCIVRFGAELEKDGVLSADAAAVIREAAVAEVDAAQAEAETAPLPDPATVMRYVYGE